MGESSVGDKYGDCHGDREGLVGDAMGMGVRSQVGAENGSTGETEGHSNLRRVQEHNRVEVREVPPVYTQYR